MFLIKNMLLVQCYLLATCRLPYLLVTCLLLGVASRREAMLNLTLSWCVEHVGICFNVWMCASSVSVHHSPMAWWRCIHTDWCSERALWTAADRACSLKFGQDEVVQDGGEYQWVLDRYLRTLATSNRVSGVARSVTSPLIQWQHIMNA